MNVMAWLEIAAPAKINLFLELVKKREDGFHELETIMTRVALRDQLFIRKRKDEKICLALHSQLCFNRFATSEKNSMPLDQSNLIWKALNVLRGMTGNRTGLDVVVEKRIPAQAGLGGGSSNAAAALLGANRLLRLGQTETQLQAAGNQLGSDIAFFLGEPTAVCTGRGEKLEPIPAARNIWLTIAMPPTGLATADVFRLCQVPSSPEDSQSLREALRKGDVQQLGRHLRNRLQNTADKLSPWVRKLQSEFQRLNCCGHQMTGSGTAYFGLFRCRNEAMRASRILTARLPESQVFCTCTTV